MISINARPEIEAHPSWELFQTRDRHTTHRQLKRHPQEEHNNRQHRHEHHHHKSPPPVSENTQHGMMIDAGSQGSRIHVYEFEARILSHKEDLRMAVAGKKLSIPTTDTRWTDRLQPGLDAFAFIQDEEEMLKEIGEYLMPLFDFARSVLAAKSKHWKTYPCYLKATGGLRALPRPYRIRLIKAVRKIMADKSFNPFYFEEEYARVISGEEEAIYGWTAVNFAKGSLIQNSEGSGSVLTPNRTYGVLEMGGMSSQIGFFEPEGDVMANLFKLQIGSAKHWNVYAHSFLYFGVKGAYSRLNARLFHDHAHLSNQSNKTFIYNPCLPGGSDYHFTSRVRELDDGTLLPLSSALNLSILDADLYSAVMGNDNAHGDYDACKAAVVLLLRQDANAWCNFAHDRDCSFAGIYQPPLPISVDGFGEFVATSNFYHTCVFLGLDEGRLPLEKLRDRTRLICSFSLDELELYNKGLDKVITDPDDLKAMCFRATFIHSFLVEGVGFPDTYNISVHYIVNGQKLGWALGSMLYEINTLPWKFKKKFLNKLLMTEALMGGNMDVEDAFWVAGALLCMVVAAGMTVSLYRSLARRLVERDRNAATSPQEVSTITGLLSVGQANYGARKSPVDRDAY